MHLDQRKNNVGVKNWQQRRCNRHENYHGMKIKRMPDTKLQKSWVDKQDHSAPIHGERGGTERDDECH